MLGGQWSIMLCACVYVYETLTVFSCGFLCILFFVGDFVTESHLLLGLLEGRLKLFSHVILKYECGHVYHSCPLV